MEAQTVYQDVIKYAALKHTEAGQTIPGTTLPYVVHLSNVAMEILIAGQQTDDFNLPFAVKLALLHDTLEDTNTTFEELEQRFGEAVALGVAALTKNGELSKIEKMTDSLQRIKMQSKEVWAVKLADRITNLQPPPAHWDAAKIAAYKVEAEIILKELKGGNAYLESRLTEKIKQYG